MLNLHDVPDLGTWAPIAQRHRLRGQREWAAVEGAPLTLAQATQLRDAGELVQALAYRDEQVFVVVRRPRGTNPQ